MARRETRFFDLMDRLEYEHPETPSADRCGYDRYTKHVPKAALVEIAGLLGVETSGDKPEIRHRIREHVCSGEILTEPSTVLNTKELFAIGRAIDELQYLDAEDVDIWDQLPKWYGTIVIDGVEYEVTDKSRSEWKSSWGDERRYDTYEMYYLGKPELSTKRKRLAVIRGQTEYCRYDHSVAVEKARGYGPYKQWEQESWVKEVSVP